ncbi:putative protein OS=Streptomyces microflavus OX=1919 GN=Smic_47170 PE=4 SV=1 [Streptomyces microflavus]
MFTQKDPARAMRGQVVDVRATMKATSGGSSESEAKDWQANPVGPSASRAVTTVTPLAKLPSTRRNSAGSTGSRSSSRTALRSGRGSSSGSGGSAVVAAPTDLRYRTAVAAMPACPITPPIRTDASSDVNPCGHPARPVHAPVRRA